MALQWGLLAILQSSAPAAAPWKPKVSRFTLQHLLTTSTPTSVSGHTSCLCKPTPHAYSTTMAVNDCCVMGLQALLHVADLHWWHFSGVRLEGRPVQPSMIWTSPHLHRSSCAHRAGNWQLAAWLSKTAQNVGTTLSDFLDCLVYKVMQLSIKHICRLRQVCGVWRELAQLKQS